MFIFGVLVIFEIVRVDWMINHLFENERYIWQKHMLKTSSSSSMTSRMLIVGFLLGFLLIGLPRAAGQSNQLKLCRLKYNGGGDWYSSRTALPNLSQYANSHIGTNLEGLFCYYTNPRRHYIWVDITSVDWIVPLRGAIQSTKIPTKIPQSTFVKSSRKN